MDFLDPEKQKAHSRRIAIGYALMAVALVLATTILLFLSRGFGLDRHGDVVQSGFVFMSSHHTGADIFVNGLKYKSQTNTRLQLSAGQYTVTLQRNGYRDWQHAINVDGGHVERFDYPFLFPIQLVTTVVKQYSQAPLFMTQSPNQRYLLVQALAPDQFDQYDLRATKPVAQPLVVPADILAAGSTTTGWKVAEWGGDSRHLILQRSYQKTGQPGSEYILFDRQNPSASQNLSVLWGFSPTSLALVKEAYDNYYLFDQNSGQLFTATLKAPTPQPFLSGVAAYAVSQDSLLYATATDAPVGKVLIRLRQDGVTYTIRQETAGGLYLLDLAQYKNDWYVAVGAQATNKVYIYKNPSAQLQNSAQAVAAPIVALKVTKPTYVSFAPGSRLVAAQNGSSLDVFDAETARRYSFQLQAPLDPPQLYAAWMDGYHVEYYSRGLLYVTDFDGTNTQKLLSGSPAFAPFFRSDYNVLFNLDAQNALVSTSLLAPQDQ